MDVSEWLRKLGFDRYASAFRENNIDAEVLPSLTAEDLKDLGIVLVGDRRRILQAIAGLLRQEAVAQPDPSITKPSHFPAHASVSPAAERRQLTVVFCDLVGSTPLSGQLDPEEYRGVITSFQKAVSEATRRFDGHVAKYLGDGVLAYFGYPQAHEDDAERAIRSSIEALAAVQRLTSGPGLPLDARVGIATGLVVAGDIAVEGVSEAGAISGETPNLAARLQALARPGEIIIDQGSERLVEGIFHCEALGPQNLKGVAAPVSAWRVRELRQAESRFDARHSAALTEFVGRANEFETLLRRWEQARRGEGQVVLISGEPGIGKSRLTQHFRSVLPGDAYISIRYQCSPHHASSAFYPAISQLALAAGITPHQPPPAQLNKLEALLAMGANEVAAVAPLFAELLSIPYADRYLPLGLTPQDQKARTLEALKGQLLGLARRKPVVFVAEDLHWLDPSTQHLLDVVVECIEGAPVLVLMTFRPEYKARWIGQPHVTLIALSRLSRRQCAEMARHVVAKAALPDSVLEAIVQRTEGVPLFIEELTRALLEGGTSTTVPTTIQASLLARLDRLGTAKQLAQIGSVIGRDFERSLLAAVSPMSEIELEEGLTRLVASELVFQRGDAPDVGYTFKHALVQDTAYESLLKSRRRQIHGEIATALRRLYPTLELNQPELLAHHYNQAGLSELAIDYWERAGNRALQLSANQEALGHYRAALSLLEALPEQTRRRRELTLQVGLGSALTSVVGYSASVTGAAYRRARELCLELQDRKYIVPVFYGLWNYDNSANRYVGARETATELLELASRHEDRGPLIAAHSALGTTHLLMGSYVSAAENLQRCVELYRAHGCDISLAVDYGEDPCVQAQSMHSLSLWNLGYPDRAKNEIRDALRLAEGIHHANSIAYALAMTPLLNCLIGEPQVALETAELGAAYTSEKGIPFWLCFAKAVHGWSLCCLQSPEQGLAEISSAIEYSSTTGNSALLAAWHSLRAEGLRLAGRREEALSAVDDGLKYAESCAEGLREAELHRQRGLVLQDQAHREGAESSFLQALKVARQQGSVSMQLRVSSDLACLWQEQRKSREALDLLGPIYALFTEGFTTPDLMRAQTLLAELKD